MNIVTGDILNITSGLVVQQVNCQGIIAPGLNRRLFNKYPLVEESFVNISRKLDPKGQFGCVDVIKATDTLYVANSYSQFGFGDARKSGKVFTDLRTLVGNLVYLTKRFDDVPIYAPYKIGCGLGGGDWNVLQSKISTLPLIFIRPEGADW